MSRIWAIADLHLSLDPAVGKPMDRFGGIWEGHDRRIEEIWKRMVEPEDLVIIAGDISWALKLEEAMADLRWIDALPGEKVLIKGNHDLWWPGISKLRSACAELKSLNFLQHSAMHSHGAVVFGTRGWLCPGARDFGESDEAIYKRELMRLGAAAAEATALADAAEERGGARPVLIGALHYPPTNETLEPSGFTDIFERSGASSVVYGHLHGQSAFKNGPQGKLGNVEYSLVSLDRLECCPKLIYEKGGSE